MIRTNTNSRASFLGLFAAILLIFTGCNSAAEKETNSGTKTSTNSTATSNTAASNASTSGPETPSAESSNQANSLANSDSASVIINGGLDTVDWRSLVGQRITVTGDLVVVDTYDLVRRGQIKVARDRLYVPTSQIDPNDKDPSATSYEGGSNVAKVTQAQKFNDNATIIIDDGTADENIFPPKLFPELGKKSLPTVRIGSVIKGVSGKLVKAGNNLLLVPNKRLRWTPAKRPQRPDVGNADIVVSSFNVLNYFTTIDNGKNNARGADTKSELDRQESKLVAAITAIQADVVGLMEIENNIEAENRLVAALNKKMGKEVFKGCGLPAAYGSAPGGKDSIRVGIIYRTDRVEPVGEVSMIRDDVFYAARTPIVQTFKSKTADSPFTLIVNHFKSKGGADRADADNKNKGDGQGAYNATRRSQSLAVCKYIDSLKQGDAEPRVLVMGDLNAYRQEDPIDAMRAKGLIDLHETPGKERSGHSDRQYSYIYYGQCGSLDHAMATKSLAADVTGIATWHINADEPRFLDYNEEHNPKTLFQANPFRSSDHDPVLIGIRN